MLNFKISLRKVSLGLRKRCELQPNKMCLTRGLCEVIFSNFKDLKLVQVYASFQILVLGYDAYIGMHSHFLHTTVERFCSIGPIRCCILGIYPTEGFMSIHSAFFSTHNKAGFIYTCPEVGSVCAEKSWRVFQTNR